MEKQIIYTVKNEDEALVNKVVNFISIITMANINNNEAVQKLIKEKNIEIQFIIK